MVRFWLKANFNLKKVFLQKKFCCTGSRGYSLVGKMIIIIILSFKVGTSRNKNIDNQGKQTCAYESNHNFLL